MGSFLGSSTVAVAVEAPLEARTERLWLRPWREEGVEPFAALNADPRVMEHFPAMPSRAETEAMVARIRAYFAQHGWGARLTRAGHPPYECRMKYSTEIEIDLPVARVVELFDNPDNMKHWMEGLVSFEPLSGTPGQPGARSRLRFKMGRRDIEMVETILVRNLPQEFSGTYEAQGVVNKSTNRFLPSGDTKTRYVSEQEFDLKGFMKVIGWLMPGMFKKQSLKYQQDFKKFAESQRAS